MKTVSATAHVLYQNILASLAENDGRPVFVKNPHAVELIDAGLLVETSPRESWSDCGVSHVMFVVRKPGA